MYDRIIRSHGGTLLLKDTLSSLLLLEVLIPSKEIYLISPWISNAPIIDNKNGQFIDLFPYAESQNITLSEIIKTLVNKGTSMRIICDLSDNNTIRFIREIGNVAGVEFRDLKNNHEKGLCTENFYLHGSMNFTYRGIHINGENVRVTLKPEDIKQALLYLRNRWREAEINESN